MKPRQHDPRHLDVARFAAAGGELSGVWPAHDLPRLAGSQTAPVDLNLEPVRWSARGESRAVPGAAPQSWLHVEARTAVWLTCQRCLQPIATPVEAVASLQFVRDEAQAEALDAESEHDVLALAGPVNLRELVEDELLLALPIVPRHDACPQSLPASAGQDPAVAPADGPASKPFAGLAGLKRGSA